VEVGVCGVIAVFFVYTNEFVGGYARFAGGRSSTVSVSVIESDPAGFVALTV